MPSTVWVQEFDIQEFLFTLHAMCRDSRGTLCDLRPINRNLKLSLPTLNKFKEHQVLQSSLAKYLAVFLKLF